MSDSIFAGCDLHEQTLVIRIALGQGLSQRKIYSNNRAGQERLIADLKKQGRREGAAGIVFGYEASGQGFLLYDRMQAAGIECHVLAPTKMEASVKQKRNKNDDRDAERILKRLRAYKLAGEQLPSVWVPDLETRDDREVVRCREDLANKLSTVKVQLRCLLQRNGVEKPSKVGKPWTQSHRQWMEALTQDTLYGFGMRTVLGNLLRQVLHLESEITQLDKAVEQVSQKPHRKAIIDALDKEIGVGRLTATAYVAEMGDFSRFRRGRQVGAYWGLSPSSNESGEIHDRKGHITRQGSPRIRKLLCQATWYRVKNLAPECAVYQRLVGRNPRKKKIAVVACMRRLSVRLWHIGLQAQLAIEQKEAR
jgi:transposase